MSKAATPASKNARFRATGTYPFNPSIAPDDSFAQSFETESENALFFSVVTVTGTPAPPAVLSHKQPRRASSVLATSGKAAPTKTNSHMFFSSKPDVDDTERNAIISVSGREKSRRIVSVKDQSHVCF